MDELRRYADYDAFAWIYNKHWGWFAERVLPVLERLALRGIPSQGRVLDLCCGTGQLAHLLTERGYRVTGIDGSEEMLRYARQNASEAEFILADARTFTLPNSFHLALSVFDSLNHIMSLKELALTFGNVYRALLPGGLFLFDLNMEEGFTARWRGPFGIVEEDHVCVGRSSYRAEEHVGQADFTIFRLVKGAQVPTSPMRAPAEDPHPFPLPLGEGGVRVPLRYGPEPDASVWQRTDVALLQKCYAEPEIREALEDAKFQETQTFDAQRDLGWQRDVGRTFFLCRRAVTAVRGQYG